MKLASTTQTIYWLCILYWYEMSCEKFKTGLVNQHGLVNVEKAL